MEFIGEEDEPAPQLKDVRLSAAEARAVFDRLVWNVELFLANHLVHADLSPYNVLHRTEGLTIIDLPQAVDARSNSNARALLGRDVENLCRHFERLGVRTNPSAQAGDLWRRFLYARI
jgi:RIO kinase 1